jgi:hypothetical protein
MKSATSAGSFPGSEAFLAVCESSFTNGSSIHESSIFAGSPGLIAGAISCGDKEIKESSCTSLSNGWALWKKGAISVGKDL